MLTTLIERFEDVDQLPIEIEELVEVITALGFQDEVHLFPVDCDPDVIRGVFTQFRYSQGMYGEARWVTHIAYTQNVPLDWQRVICAKELVHIFDSQATKTDTEDEVVELLEKLVGPLSTEQYGLVDLMAAKDRLALYQCLPLLLPRASLEVARDQVRLGQQTVRQVAEWACMPATLVALMLSDEWAELNGTINDICL